MVITCFGWCHHDVFDGQAYLWYSSLQSWTCHRGLVRLASIYNISQCLCTVYTRDVGIWYSLSATGIHLQMTQTSPFGLWEGYECLSMSTHSQVESLKRPLLRFRHTRSVVAQDHWEDRRQLQQQLRCVAWARGTNARDSPTSTLFHRDYLTQPQLCQLSYMMLGIPPITWCFREIQHPIVFIQVSCMKLRLFIYGHMPSIPIAIGVSLLVTSAAHLYPPKIVRPQSVKLVGWEVLPTLPSWTCHP